ncbi:MAG: ATP-binding protein [Lewinellaceae bacterium]|nr:ATP-binding protein [Lewinellaceae bacterium]
MFVPRRIVPSLQQQLGKYPVLALTGPRQSGKTTILQEVFPEYTYVSLENVDIRERALTDPNGFLRTYDNMVIFDEVQRAPSLFSYLQTKVDRDKKMGQYILSGSQNFLLLDGITQSLAGRVALFKLFPFSFSEMLSAQLLADNWMEATFTGFYPAIFDRKVEAPVFYNNYLETYVERDVRNLRSVQDLRVFRLFLKRCAANAGQLLNLNRLAIDTGITIPTAKAWLSILESSYIVFMLSPYFRNFKKRLVKTPKLFFYDTGLLCNLLEIKSPADLDNYFQRGSIFENLILAEIVKDRWHHGERPSFYFWLDNHQVEVDLVWEEQSHLNLLEIKSSHTVLPNHFKGIEKVSKTLGDFSGKRFGVYAGDSGFYLHDVEVMGWKEMKF